MANVNCFVRRGSVVPGRTGGKYGGHGGGIFPLPLAVAWVEPEGSMGGAAGVFPVCCGRSWLRLVRISVLDFFLEDRVCIGRGRAGGVASQ